MENKTALETVYYRLTLSFERLQTAYYGGQYFFPDAVLLVSNLSKPFETCFSKTKVMITIQLKPEVVLQNNEQN